jgi:hypothetical protein
MNAEIHAKLSCKGVDSTSESDFDFFYKIHDFFDCSKEVEPSNKHRIFLHSMWAVKRIIIPIFGRSYTCSNGKVVNIKDDCEQNHLLADFKFKFIPTLQDYFSLVEDDEKDAMRFINFKVCNFQLFNRDDVRELMYSPLAITGNIKSLWLTHNSWFIGEILPKIFKTEFKIKNYSDISPSILFNRMKYDDWLQNGQSYPPSFSEINKYRKQIHEQRRNKEQD